MMNSYSIPVGSVDAHVAFDSEADRADVAGMTSVAKRQRATALHIRNAVHHMQKICPPGYRVETNIVVSYVPDVNPVLKDEHRR